VDPRGATDVSLLPEVPCFAHTRANFHWLRADPDGAVRGEQDHCSKLGVSGTVEKVCCGLSLSNG